MLVATVCGSFTASAVDPPLSDPTESIFTALPPKSLAARQWRFTVAAILLTLLLFAHITFIIRRTVRLTGAVHWQPDARRNSGLEAQHFSSRSARHTHNIFQPGVPHRQSHLGSISCFGAVETPSMVFNIQLGSLMTAEPERQHNRRLSRRLTLHIMDDEREQSETSSGSSAAHELTRQMKSAASDVDSEVSQCSLCPAYIMVSSVLP